MHIYEFDLNETSGIHWWNPVLGSLAFYMYIRGPPQLVLFIPVHQNKKISLWKVFPRTHNSLSNLVLHEAQ